jgi:hypothetical protein
MATAAKDKLTGRGEFQKLPDGSTLLFNFDIDSSVLKPEHRAFLEQNIVSAANASPGGLRVVVGGSADRLGDAGHNVALSNRRIEAVTSFLKQRKPGYPWDFVGFGEGVGEATAERAGDKDDTRDDLFRSVIIEVLARGRPIPPKPSIPKRFPKKPNVFPRPLPRPNPSTCLTEQNCPLSRNFSIQLLAGVSAGEILETAFFTFLIKDLDNRLECLYSLVGAGLANPGLPASVSAVGKPSVFHPGKATKVTNFGPVGGISSLTLPTNPTPAFPLTVFSILDFSFHDSGSVVPSGNVFIGSFDTGPISIPGAGIHGGRFKAQSLCLELPGAGRA